MARPTTKARRAGSTDAVLKELRAFGLAYPGAHTKSPWPGHLDLAVKDKTFAYLSIEGEPLRISCKLPATSSIALMLPFVTPTPYGLGKAGWVSASYAAGEAPDVEMLKAWIDESYRAQAPKKLVASLGMAPNHGARPATKTRTKPKPTTRAVATRAKAKPAARAAKR